ncbi:hypothetical protein DPMN_175324 [Dreissena polymorpha]|uniref:Uncharacterized protein n=1 Tax=Dreissena polymorpha TaxID=45954 RepID=A0A9D4E718_DREPO|nr:hypothetical protein DPMN_175324 [Dreissena polymorpha]
MQLGPNLWFFPMAMIHMDAIWNYRHALMVRLDTLDQGTAAQKRRLDDLFEEHTVLQTKIRKLEESPVKNPTACVPAANVPNIIQQSTFNLNIPPDFLDKLHQTIKDGMSDSTVTVTGGDESIWARLLGIGVQAISTVGGDVAAASIAAAVETEGNLVNSAVEGLIQGSVSSQVSSTVNAVVGTATERLSKEASDGVNKAIDALVGKEVEDKNRDRLINTNQLAIDECKRLVATLEDKVNKMQTLDITKALAMQATVEKNADLLEALEARMLSAETFLTRQGVTLTDISVLTTHNIANITNMQQYVNTYLKKMVIPYMLESYPEMFGRL